MTKQLPQRSKKKHNHNNVLVDEPHIKSYANLVLLNNYFQELEHEDFLNIYLKKRRDFLYVKKNSNNGNLVCEYCDREHLSVGLNDIFIKKNRFINSTNMNLGTIDHFFPVTNHKDLFWNTDNWVVSCKKCNNKKSDKDPFKWVSDNFGKTFYTEGIQRIIAQDLYL